MLRNFTAIDIVGTVEASLLLTLILFIPGYVIGWLSNVFDFRARRFAMQAMLSTPLAVAVLPILIYLLGRYPKALFVCFGATWIGFAFLFRNIWKRWRHLGLRRVPRTAWIAGAFVLAWAFIAIATLADLQFRGRLYLSATAYDNSTHTAFVAAAARSIPPANPFFASNPPALLRYHHFWMLLCSLVTRFWHVGPRHALYGGTVWAGIALMSLIVISLKFLVGVQERFERKAMIACGLLLVTGLDILPTEFFYLRLGMVAPDMEWWNEQIASWVDTLVWAPHHMLGMLACLVGFLILRQPASTKYQRAMAILIAALAFASSSGLSVLASLTFALFVIVWLPLAALRKWWDEVLGLLAAGALSLVAALPYLRTLVASPAGGSAVRGAAAAGGFFTLQVRNFYLAQYAIDSAFHPAHMDMPAPALILLLLLPLNYFLELGFFFVAAALRIKSIRAGTTPMTRQEQTGWAIVATSFFVGSFLRSTTIASNDLGWRCFLQAQLVLLLWGALLLDDWWATRGLPVARRNGMEVFAALLLALGLIGTTYQVIMLRVHSILVDDGSIESIRYPWLDQDGRMGQRTFALRSVYDSLNAILPADAIVQYNPSARAFIPNQLYSAHSAAAGLADCGVVFGGDSSHCANRIQSIAPLFDKSFPAESPDLDAVCRKYNIDIMLVGDGDPVWRDRDSWIWKRTPLLANEYVRAFACGDPGRQARIESAH